MKSFIKSLLREGLNESTYVWYHGTPDVRDLESDGGFTERSITAEYIEDLDKYNEIQRQLDIARENDDDGAYHKYIAMVGPLRKKFTIRKPIFLTNVHSVAKTYADPQRAFDYQNSVEKVLKVSVNSNRGITIVATGDRFRFININKVKQGFKNAGISEDEFNLVFNQFNFHTQNRDNIRTDDIAILGEYFGFDYIDIVGVLDSYNNGNTKSTVRMVFNPKDIKILQ